MQKRIWLLALGFLVTITAITALAVLWTAHASKATGVDCSGAWYDSPDPVVKETCSREKAATTLSQADEVATAAAQPYYQTIPGFVPQVILPVPPDAKVVFERKQDPYNGPGPSGWKGATSTWRDGAVPSADYTSWDELYIIARPGSSAQLLPAIGDTASTKANPTLETDVAASLGDGTDVKYRKRWGCPQDVGALYITNITNPELNIPDANTPYPGLQSVVYFKTKTGQTGNFNMATETWTFDPTSKAP